MIHIRGGVEKITRLIDNHIKAIKGYLLLKPSSYREALFEAVKRLEALPEIPYTDCAQAENANDWDWLRNLISADVAMLRNLVQTDGQRLGFIEFLEMYKRHFAKSPSVYLFGDYNAYSLVRSLDLKVCPYCDEEYAEVIETPDDPRRTAQLDHFFSKSRCPGLAMCFYNLIPAGANCNYLKLNHALGKNPYEADIESCTRLYPDIAVGVNISALSPEECQVNFHSTPEMEKNLRVFHLSDRYKKHCNTTYKLLKRLQNYDKAKKLEMLRNFSDLFPNDAALREAMDIDLPKEGEWGKEILTKLRHDLLSRQ